MANILIVCRHGTVVLAERVLLGREVLAIVVYLARSHVTKGYLNRRKPFRPINN